MAVKRDSFSVAFTVGAYGSAFGAAAVANHFSILQACLLSLLLFSGASQFAVIGVLGAGGSAVSAIATASLLGVRNGLYALRLAPILKLRGWRKLVGAQITIDESTGVALSQSDIEDMRKGFWYTGVGVFIFWNFFTVLGAVGAKAIGNPSAWGLEQPFRQHSLACSGQGLRANKLGQSLRQPSCSHFHLFLLYQRASQSSLVRCWH